MSTVALASREPRRASLVGQGAVRGALRLFPRLGWIFPLCDLRALCGESSLALFLATADSQNGCPTSERNVLVGDFRAGSGSRMFVVACTGVKLIAAARSPPPPPPSPPPPPAPPPPSPHHAPT